MEAKYARQNGGHTFFGEYLYDQEDLRPSGSANGERQALQEGWIEQNGLSSKPVQCLRKLIPDKFSW